MSRRRSRCCCDPCCNTFGHGGFGGFAGCGGFDGFGRCGGFGGGFGLIIILIIIALIFCRRDRDRDCCI